jgi:hypothetical protein
MTGYLVIPTICVILTIPPVEYSVLTTYVFVILEKLATMPIIASVSRIDLYSHFGNKVIFSIIDITFATGN